MLDKMVAGMALQSADFISNLQPLIAAKKAEFAKSEFAQMIQKIESDETEQEIS